MKQFYYIANIRFPTEKAHGVQIAKMCEAFASEGVHVELVTTNRKTGINENSFEYYGIEQSFKLTKLWCLDTVHWGWLGFWIESVTFAKRVGLYVLFKKGTFYTRDEFLAFYLRILGKKVVWEAHMGQSNIFVKFLIKTKVPIVVISRGLKDHYINMAVPEEQIRVAQDGVDLTQFNIEVDKDIARQKLGLDVQGKLIVYPGQRQLGKGLEILEEAVKLMGGDVELLVVENKPYKDIPMYLKASDLFVLPNSAKTKLYGLYTSPMKLFEYMASCRPIVASDLPTVREVLDESCAYFFTPDDPASLTTTIRKVLSEYSVALGKAELAKRLAEQYTWEQRAKSVLRFIS